MSEHKHDEHCSHHDHSHDHSHEPAPAAADPALQSDLYENLTPDGGVKKRILKAGEGHEQPEDGAEVFVHYVGKLMDGTQFDSSRERVDPFSFKLGAHSVIKGWEVAVKSMKKRELAEVVLGPDYAYGHHGSPPKIPANATLRFEIELLRWTTLEDVSKKKDGSVLKRTLKAGEGWERPKRETEVTLVVREPLETETQVSGTVGAVELGALGRLCKHLRRGERAVFTVRPPFAWPPVLPALAKPPAESLVLDLELVELRKEKEAWEISTEEKFQAAATRKDHGNRCFKEGDIKRAKKRYKSALACLTSDHAFSDEEKKRSKEAQTALHLNLAACALKQSLWKEASEAAGKALECSPGNEKALYRHAQALAELGDLRTAAADVDKALVLHPKSSDLTQLAQRISQMQIEQDRRDQALFKKMFV